MFHDIRRALCYVKPEHRKNEKPYPNFALLLLPLLRNIILAMSFQLTTEAI